MPEPWWKSAVFYQVYPLSFCDTDGDGFGDLEGIRRHLDHLEWLGVDAIWLSPLFPSPMADFGYDVGDYCDIDPRFGTLGDFDRLLGDAHDRGLRAILDWIPNHTSDRHPWFAESRSARSSPKRDWYIWRDGRDGEPPNHWKAAFGGNAWTYDEGSGQWYLHLFLPQQPDLNWRNPEVEQAMAATMRFWLDRGVDGFRVDAVHCVAKDPELADTPADLEGRTRSGFNDHPDVHPILRRLRRVADSYPGDRVLVGEVYLPDAALVAPYYGRGDELHLAFNFAPLLAPWDAAAWHREVTQAATQLEAVGGWPTWVLSNHDQPRHRTRYGGQESRARAAAVLLLTLRGTPFVYAGEELGLEDAIVPPERRVDPGGRDGCRAPIPWDASPAHGWASDDPWLPWPPDAGERSPSALRGQTSSIVHLYRRMLAARRASPVLRLGDSRLLPSGADVLAYERSWGADRAVVAIAFDGTARLPLEGDWVVELSSDGAGEGRPFTGELAADQAVLLRPAPLGPA